MKNLILIALTLVSVAAYANTITVDQEQIIRKEIGATLVQKNLKRINLDLIELKEVPSPSNVLRINFSYTESGPAVVENFCRGTVSFDDQHSVARVQSIECMAL